MKISWGRAAAGALAAEAAQIVAAIAWVAVYSHLIDPGKPMAVYEARARTSGPWVSILAGAPIFYAASRWIARNLASAMALFGIFLLIDDALLIAMTPDWNNTPWLLFGLSYLSKLVSCALGGGWKK
jgi:hypothetical protein